MSLQVFTGRIWLVDPDTFNITRGSGGAQGSPFAPSQPLLTRFLAHHRTRVEQLPLWLFKAERDNEWLKYTEAYTQEMRESYVAHHAEWLALLARERVVLTCYCLDVERCHRGLLADILVKLGAKPCGEIQMAKRGA